jgi:hypothetical protein
VRRHAKASSAGSSDGSGSSRGLKFVLTICALALCVLGSGASAAVAAPTVTIDPSPIASYTSAQVKGTVDTGGEEGAYTFEYSSDGGATWSAFNFEGFIPPVLPGDPTTQNASATLNGLKPATHYEVRLAAFPYSEFGAETFSPAPNPSFDTLAMAPPTVTIDPASAVTATSASFKGHVTAGNADPAFDTTSCSFEYAPLPRNERQRLDVRVSSGTYKLRFEGEVTAPVAFDASPTELESALKALSTIGAGAVSVDAAGVVHPYVVTFIGALANKDVPQLEVLTTSTNTVVPATVATSRQGQAPGFVGARTAPCDVEPITGTAATEVKADVTGLEPGTTYNLRLKAANPGGSNSAAAPDFPTGAVAPAVLDTAASDIAKTSATLNAELNPGAAATSFHFEYLTQAQYEAASGSFAGATPTPESPLIGADNEGHAALATIGGLQESTAYRYRVVAKNAKAPGGIAGPARPFRTAGPVVVAPETCANAAVRAQQGSAYLPECRAYEIVNKPTLDLGDVNRAPMIADDGEHASYISLVAPDDALGAALGSNFVASRTPTGWRSTDANLRSFSDISNTAAAVPRAFSSDFSRVAVVGSVRYNADDTDNIEDAFRVQVGTGIAEWLSPGLVLPDSTLGFVAVFGASTDLGRVFFGGSEEVFAAGAPSRAVYSNDGSGVRAESILPNGTIAGGNPVASAHEWGYIANSDPATDRTTGSFVPHGGRHPVSDDGSRVFFESGGAIYLRRHDTAPATTVAVSASQRSGEVGTVHGATFLAANHAGSLVYFFSSDRLTDTATVGGGIYRFDVTTDELEQVTPDAGDPAGLSIRSAIVSDDSRRVYFNSPALLAPGAEPGASNAYVWSVGDGLRFIAALNPIDKIERVSRDGGYALLRSSASLDGAPNDGHQAVYEYEYAGDEISCVSCRTDGSASGGDANLEEQSFGFPSPRFTAPRAITDDGKVVFATTDRLVAADQTGAADVYLYDHGKLSLISSGRSDDPSFTADNSDDGRDIFFTTRSALVAADGDPSELDLYDARSGGGFLEPPPPPAPCEGEACRSGTSPTAASVTPTTSSFEGPGNPAPCAKGKIRRNGRCVKPRKPRKAHSKKHHGKKHKAGKRKANANGRTGR